jgi:hypothetical protein
LPAYAEQVEEKGLEAPKVSYEHHNSLLNLAESARRGCTSLMESKLNLQFLRIAVPYPSAMGNR